MASQEMSFDNVEGRRMPAYNKLTYESSAQVG